MAADLDRRDFLRTAAAGAAMASVPAAAQPRNRQAADQPAATAPHGPRRPRTTVSAPEPARLFLTEPEAAFVTAVAEVMIPADDVGPSAVEAGVVTFIDRQLAGAWGSGARMYLNGPWAEGKPQQGYQLPLAPAALFRAAMAQMDELARADGGTSFAQLPPERRDRLLAALDGGSVALASLPGKVVVDMLRTLVIEGYFADPAYAGNRDMAAWRMIGFPGARGAYADQIEAARGKPFRADPVSLADLQ